MRLSWAHGLYIAGLLLSMLRMPPVTSALLHVLTGINAGFGWAAIFSDDDQLTGACCGRDVPTTRWALTAAGTAIELIGEAVASARWDPPSGSSP